MNNYNILIIQLRKKKEKNININDFKNKIKLKLIFYQVKKLSTLFAQKNYHQQD